MNMKDSTNSTLAQHILLSPDGYYTYLQIPKPQATHPSLIPPKEGEAGGDRQPNISTTIDKSKIEKNYRRLSLKLHPDRPGGDAETFRLLERAKSVLMSDKLRKEYDMLGLDLEEEENLGDDDVNESKDGDADGGVDDKKSDSSGNPDSVMSQMAGATVAGILQLAIRTAMMAFVTLFLSRFKYTVIPALLFLSFTAFKVRKARGEIPPESGIQITTFDIISPLLIGAGIGLLYIGRNSPESSPTEDVTEDIDYPFWTWTFWVGEALVMTIFAVNSLTTKNVTVMKNTLAFGMGLFVLFMVLCLWLRGKMWRYVSILGLEVGMALIAVIIFPIMEMVLEEIMNEKLRKVGDKVRTYAKVMEESYQKKLEAEKKKNYVNSGAVGLGDAVGGETSVKNGSSNSQDLD